MAGLTLDSGALIALEKGNDRIRELLLGARDHGLPIHVPAGVIAQVCRGGPRRATVAILLGLPNVIEVPLDGLTARAVGVLCGRSGHHDVVDVHVVLHAREHGHIVVTSDPDDLRKVDPSVSLAVI
ncbi:PIN domain-containing protein [Aeromicrobium sp.]|uniref:PIN domain-containing protein n=1 Tax=Aeromicrobium sp. TaxID=1871063 RepID=UPI002FCA4E15